MNQIENYNIFQTINYFDVTLVYNIQFIYIYTLLFP